MMRKHVTIDNLSGKESMESGGRPDRGPGMLETGSVLGGASGSAASSDTGGGGDDQPPATETVGQPAKVMRIGMMVRQLLEEVRQAPLDEASRVRMKEIYETSVAELAGALSPELSEELDRLSIPFEGTAPSEAELRVAQAQLVGWLEGLFHGIQATLVAQQMAARAQLEEMRSRELPSGMQDTVAHRPGTYL